MVRRIGLAALVLLLAAACAQNDTSSTHQLVLGAIYPLTGPQGPGGRSELAGVQAALRLSGGDVKLQVIDATTPDTAAAAVDALVQQYHVPAILGTYGSTLSAAASARAEELKTVYWETGAVADPITAQRHYVFRTVATGGSLGRMAVTFTHDVLLPRYQLGQPHAVIVRVNDIYGRSVGGGEEQLAQDRADFLWDVSYLDDGVAIWKAALDHHITFKGAIGTSSAFCMPAFSERLGRASIGVYAADKPDGDTSSAALSASGRELLARARAAYSGGSMDIPAVAGFVGGWTLFHDVLPKVDVPVNAETIRLAALGVDVPVGDSINGGGVRFAGAGALDEGQNTRAAAVVGQWRAVGLMKVVYPPAYAD